jgi:hypothetical protein
MLWPTIAWGGSPGSTSASGPGDAKFEEGVRAYEKGSFAEAVVDFKTAYAASHSAAHLWNLALAEVKADRPLEAYPDLEAYMGAPDATQAGLEHCRDLLDREDDLVGILLIDGPAGAEILLDGVSIGKAPLSHATYVDPAKPHGVEARLGKWMDRKDLSAPGTERIIRLEFRAEGPPTIVPIPRHAFDKDEDDNAPGTVAPLAAVKPKSPLRLRASGYLAADEAKNDHLPRESLVSALLLTGAVASAASAGVGGALVGSGYTKRDTGKETLGGLFLGAGVLLLAADVVTFQIWRSSKPMKPETSQVSVSPSLGGLLLHGTF